VEVVIRMVNKIRWVIFADFKIKTTSKQKIKTRGKLNMIILTCKLKNFLKIFKMSRAREVTTQEWNDNYFVRNGIQTSDSGISIFAAHFLQHSRCAGCLNFKKRLKNFRIFEISFFPSSLPFANGQLDFLQHNQELPR
jgi:hypothetical protein